MPGLPWRTKKLTTCGPRWLKGRGQTLPKSSCWPLSCSLEETWRARGTNGKRNWCPTPRLLATWLQISFGPAGLEKGLGDFFKAKALPKGLWSMNVYTLCFLRWKAYRGVGPLCHNSAKVWASGVYEKSSLPTNLSCANPKCLLAGYFSLPF